MKIQTRGSTTGLIPARAGTTRIAGRYRPAGRAHPRSRGDHEGGLKWLRTGAGSSPLARGPRRCRRHLHATAGLIPARAGTTILSPRASAEIGAHPRSRGDHARRVLVRLLVQGSSPLARGPLFARGRSGRRSGLIPARAGTTFSARFSSFASRAHPRSRGDHGRAGKTPDTPPGSSPLARGPPANKRLVIAPDGLIPARAGTT